MRNWTARRVGNSYTVVVRRGSGSSAKRCLSCWEGMGRLCVEAVAVRTTSPSMRIRRLRRPVHERIIRNEEGGGYHMTTPHVCSVYAQRFYTRQSYNIGIKALLCNNKCNLILYRSQNDLQIISRIITTVSSMCILHLVQDCYHLHPYFQTYTNVYYCRQKVITCNWAVLLSLVRVILPYGFYHKRSPDRLKIDKPFYCQ